MTPPDFDIETYLNSLPDTEKVIDVSNKNLTYLPSLKRFTDLMVLRCENNQLSSLPELNDNLLGLWCDNNQLTHLPELNQNLIILRCNNNQVTRLPELNEKLEVLHCKHNPLIHLPKINKNLKYLGCDNYLLAGLSNELNANLMVNT